MTGVPPYITREELITRQAGDAVLDLTRLVESGQFDPPPALREVFAAFAAAVARADRRRPEPPQPADVAVKACGLTGGPERARLPRRHLIPLA